MVWVVGDPHPLDELGGDLHLVQHLLDLGTAAVDHHRVQADVFHQDDPLGEALLQSFVHHGVAAVLDDHGLVVELPDIGQGLHEDGRLFDHIFSGFLFSAKPYFPPAPGSPSQPGIPTLTTPPRVPCPLDRYRMYRLKSSSSSMAVNFLRTYSSVDHDFPVLQVRGLKGQVVEQFFHDRVQSPGPDVFRPLVHRIGRPGDFGNRLSG